MIKYKKSKSKIHKYQAGGKDAANSIYAPIDKGEYIPTTGGDPQLFGHINKENPGIFHRQGENYVNLYGANAALPGLVNTPTGSLSRGEFDAWHKANDDYTMGMEFDDDDNIINDEANRRASFAKFREKYGPTSIMDDPQFTKHAEGANRMFEDPSLHRINYATSVYTKPEGEAKTPGQADYWDTGTGGLGRFTISDYEYTRPEIPRAEMSKADYSNLADVPDAGPAIPPAERKRTTKSTFTENRNRGGFDYAHNRPAVGSISRTARTRSRSKGGLLY
jgi:hypothetical protein